MKDRDAKIAGILVLLTILGWNAAVLLMAGCIFTFALNFAAFVLFFVGLIGTFVDH